MGSRTDDKDFDFIDDIKSGVASGEITARTIDGREITLAEFIAIEKTKSPATWRVAENLEFMGPFLIVDDDVRGLCDHFDAVVAAGFETREAAEKYIRDAIAADAGRRHPRRDRQNDVMKGEQPMTPDQIETIARQISALDAASPDYQTKLAAIAAPLSSPDIEAVQAGLRAEAAAALAEADRLEAGPDRQTQHKQPHRMTENEVMELALRLTRPGIPHTAEEIKKLLGTLPIEQRVDLRMWIESFRCAVQEYDSEQKQHQAEVARLCRTVGFDLDAVPQEDAVERLKKFGLAELKDGAVVYRPPGPRLVTRRASDNEA
jgi:hypothetical protein